MIQAWAIRGDYTILDLFDALPWFKPAEDWLAWRAFLAAAFGLPMTPAELAIYRECTGRTKAPTKPAREVDAICGRRAGKSRVQGSVVVPFFALLRDYRGVLAPGERATIPVLAKDKDDAQAILGYCKATFALDAFRPFVVKEHADGLSLSNGVDVQIRAARITAARSRTVPVASLDEIAFWPTEDSAQPDAEIIAGIRPAMATVPGAMIWKLSSPYARRGVLWHDFEDHYGREDDPVLVWKAPTLRMHPRSPQVEAEVARAYAEDPANAAAEYGAEFRSDVEAFVTIEAVRACTTPRLELPPVSGVRYWAFVDPSGGQRDPFSFGVSHWDHARQRAVVDLLDERKPPFDPSAVVSEIVVRVKPYGVTYVTGDAYAGEWPRAEFLKHGLAYHVSDKHKIEIYLNFLPLLNGAIADLPDLPRLQAQLVGLDRRTARGGRDSIDHLPGAFDDLANSCAGSAVLASEKGRYIQPETPEKQYLTPQGTPDYMALRREELRLALEKARKPVDEDEGNTPRYGYQP
jgi:hypothetical protein